MKTFDCKASGFTLVEMAIVLVIIGLLLGGMLMPLSAQMDQRRVSETQKALDEIKNALIGFAVMNGRLPCPTTTADPANANYGVEDATCPITAVNGYLPWKTLGVAEIDAWGITRTATASPWIGYWRYRVDPGFAVIFTLTTPTDSTLNLAVQDSSGTALTSTTQRPLAIIFSTGKNLTADGANATAVAATSSATYQSDTPTQTFDDIAVWLPAPTLFNRMVAAGKLP